MGNLGDPYDKYAKEGAQKCGSLAEALKAIGFHEADDPKGTVVVDGGVLTGPLFMGRLSHGMDVSVHDVAVYTVTCLENIVPDFANLTLVLDGALKPTKFNRKVDASWTFDSVAIKRRHKFMEAVCRLLNGIFIASKPGWRCVLAVGDAETEVVSIVEAIRIKGLKAIGVGVDCDTGLHEKEWWIKCPPNLHPGGRHITTGFFVMEHLKHMDNWEAHFGYRIPREALPYLVFLGGSDQSPNGCFATPMVPVEGFRLLLEAEGGFEAGASDCKKLEAILRILLASPKYSKRGLETVLKNIDSIPSVILKRNIDELGRDPAVLKNFEVAQFLCDVVGRETGNRVDFSHWIPAKDQNGFKFGMLHPESIAEQPLPEGGTLLETASAAKYSWPGLASFEYPKQMDDVDDNDTLDFGCVDGEEAMRLCSSDDPVTRPDPEDPEWPACVNYRISRAMEDLPEEQLEPGLVTLSIRGVLGNQSLARATGLNYITINDRGLAAQQIVKDVLFSVDLLLSTSKRAKLMLARAEREQTLKVVSNLDEAPPSNDERQSYIDFIRHPAFPGDVALAIREACEDGFGECVVLRFKGVTLKVPSSRAEQASALVTKATTSLDGFLRDWELDQDRHALSRIRMPVEKRPPPTDLAAWRRGAKLALEEIIGCSSCGGPEESFAFCIGRLLHFYLKIPIELKHQLADESSKLRAAYYETLDFHSPFPFDETARAIKILDVPKLPMHSNVFMWNDLARHAAEMAISKLMCKRSDVPVQTSFRFYRNGVQAAVNVPRVLRKTTSADTEGGAIYDPDPDFVKDIGLAVDEVANARKARKAYELDEIVQQVKAANAKDRPHPDKIGVWFQVFKELLRREIGAGTFAVHTTTGWKYVSFELVHNFDKHKVEMYISDPALETRFKTVAKEVRKLYDEACEAIRAEAGGGRRKRQRKG